MKTFFTIIAVVFFLCAPFWYGFVIYGDMMHPQDWDNDWMHDPRHYLPLMLVVFPLLGCLWIWKCLKTKRLNEEVRRELRREAAGARETTNQQET